MPNYRVQFEESPDKPPAEHVVSAFRRSQYRGQYQPPVVMPNGEHGGFITDMHKGDDGSLHVHIETHPATDLVGLFPSLELDWVRPIALALREQGAPGEQPISADDVHLTYEEMEERGRAGESMSKNVRVPAMDKLNIDKILDRLRNRQSVVLGPEDDLTVHEDGAVEVRLARGEQRGEIKLDPGSAVYHEVSTGRREVVPAPAACFKFPNPPRGFNMPCASIYDDPVRNPDDSFAHPQPEIPSDGEPLYSTASTPVREGDPDFASWRGKIDHGTREPAAEHYGIPRTLGEPMRKPPARPAHRGPATSDDGRTRQTQVVAILAILALLTLGAFFVAGCATSDPLEREWVEYSFEYRAVLIVHNENMTPLQKETALALLASAEGMDEEAIQEWVAEQLAEQLE